MAETPEKPSDPGSRLELSTIQIRMIMGSVYRELKDTKDPDILKIRKFSRLLVNDMITKMNELMYYAVSVEEKSSIVLRYMHGVTQEALFQMLLFDAEIKNISYNQLYDGMYNIGIIVYKKLMLTKYRDKFIGSSDLD